MYDCQHFIAGSMSDAFHRGLEAALLRSGLRVVARNERPQKVASRESWIPFGVDAPPSLSYVELPSEPAYGPTLRISARVCRHPRWNFQLARALSALTGSFGLVLVNDRMFSDYGRAAFFAGRTLDAVGASVAGLELRMGYGPDWTDAALGGQCDEEVNQRAFDRQLERLARSHFFWEPHDDAPVRELILEHIDPKPPLWNARWQDRLPELFGRYEGRRHLITTPLPSRYDAPLCLAAIARVDEAGFVRAAASISLPSGAEGWTWRVRERPAEDPTLEDGYWCLDEEARTARDAAARGPLPYVMMRQRGGLEADHLIVLSDRLDRPVVATVLEGPDRPAICWSKVPGAPPVLTTAVGASAFIGFWEPFAKELSMTPWQLRWPPGPVGEEPEPARSAS